MTNQFPEHLYKYQSFKDRHAVENLFSCNAIFSSRLNFNDPFDSRIKIEDPTLEEALCLLRKTTKFRGSAEQCQSLLQTARDLLEEQIDRYAFYCLSQSGKNNLMWSYYADGHRGFCIEFRSEYIPGMEVSYQDSLPTINLTDLLAGDDNRIQLADVIWKALRVKLIEWKHENEFRLHASKTMVPIASLPDGKGKIYSYKPDFIESIIFGCQTSEADIEHMKAGIPYRVQFKKAIPLNGRIDRFETCQ